MRRALNVASIALPCGALACLALDWRLAWKSLSFATIVTCCVLFLVRSGEARMPVAAQILPIVLVAGILAIFGYGFATGPSHLEQASADQR